MKKTDETINLGHYQLNSDYTIGGVVSNDNPEPHTYNPFGKEIIPFWLVSTCSFEGLNNANKKYIKEHPELIMGTNPDNQQFWTFTFTEDIDGFVQGNTIELFWWVDYSKDQNGVAARKSALGVQAVFLQLLSDNVRVQIDEVNEIHASHGDLDQIKKEEV